MIRRLAFATLLLILIVGMRTSSSAQPRDGAADAVSSAAAQEPEQTKVPDAETLVGKPEGTPLTGDALTARTQEIAAEIRCPVCQGLAIADSPSEMAQNMKGQVRALLARGYTETQILSYFERSYGQFVLLKPKFQGVNSLVWMLPVAALILGIAIVVVKMRRLEAPAAESAAVVETKNDAPAAEAEELDPYLARVRELVKGEGK